MNAGIIVAAGEGTRYGSYKQMEPLLDKKVYQYALDVFLGSELIDIIYLVVNKDLYGLIEKDLNKHNTSKSIILCEGGDTRAQSVYNAIMLIDHKYDKVCIHDAVRPLITKKDIKNVILNCPDGGGCVVGKKIYDTIKKVDNTTIVETVNRNNIWLSQTPQAFCLKTIRNCYNDNFAHFTDEASLLESHKYKMQIIESTNMNTKITTEKDLQLARQLLSKHLTGLGIDFHSLIEGDHLIVGGHKIDCHFSSKAHSDGDVLTHSIIDALLGALNLGDIGEHFPNTPENLNIDSTKLLKKIVQKIPNNKKILHIDSSIILNEPKISPHKKAIKQSLSRVLGVSSDKISIKSTTTNGLAFLDMSTGWGAQTILILGDDS
tara:strand:- start:615 stop:1742 length:1128 start_codon:yes stop_codon:yes gene_type:complete